MNRLAAVLLLFLAACSREPLPVLGAAPEFTLTDQNGQSFSSASLRGHVWLADLIFTTCMGPCPLMSARMGKVQDAIRDLPDVRLVTFTVDPETDTPEVMARYAARYQARPGVWYFLTGPSSPPRFPAVEGGKGSHSTRFILVDRQFRIRGYFSSDQEAMPQLVSAIRRLAAE